MIADCNSDVKDFSILDNKLQKKGNDIIRIDGKLEAGDVAYTKDNSNNEIKVTYTDISDQRDRLARIWLDTNKKSYNLNQLYLKADTKLWNKYHKVINSICYNANFIETNEVMPLPPKSLSARLCNILTPGCLQTRVAAEAGGSKKRAKKTRKQRKHRNSKRNNKKLH
jgi:hypothetical protein